MECEDEESESCEDLEEIKFDDSSDIEEENEINACKMDGQDVIMHGWDVIYVKFKSVKVSH